VSLSPSRFAETMAALEKHCERDLERRFRNLSRLRANVDRLDAPAYMPMPDQPDSMLRSQARETMSSPPRADESEALLEEIRARLPRRRDPNAGGPFGASIIADVLASYGDR
jgi:HAMP domain-containing protein